MYLNYDNKINRKIVTK